MQVKNTDKSLLEILSKTNLISFQKYVDYKRDTFTFKEEKNLCWEPRGLWSISTPSKAFDAKNWNVSKKKSIYWAFKN